MNYDPRNHLMVSLMEDSIMDTTPPSIGFDDDFEDAQPKPTARPVGQAAVFPTQYPPVEAANARPAAPATVYKPPIGKRLMQISVLMRAPDMTTLSDATVSSTYKCTCCGNMQINLQVTKEKLQHPNVYRRFLSRASFLNPHTAEMEEHTVQCIQTLDTSDVRNSCRRKFVF